MRPARFAFAFVCLLVAGAAFAQSQVTVSPRSVFQFAAEEVLTLSGTNIAGADHTLVAFSGQFGTEIAVADPVDANDIILSLPPLAASTPGTVSIEVRAYDTPSGSPRLFSGVLSVLAIPQTNPPILGLPEVVIAEAVDNTGANVNFVATAINDDGSPVPVSCSQDSGDHFPLGTTVVTCSATNLNGTSTGAFLIVVEDTVPPVLTLPSDISTTNPVVTFTASAVDAIDGPLPVTCSPASGSTFASNAVTIVRCIATDTHANEAFGTFKVQVGNVAPTLTLPAYIDAEATSAAGAVVTYIATADQGAIPVCSPASGSTFALGATTVNCSATNSTGQTSTGSFVVTVIDTTPPAITAHDITAEATGPNGAAVNYTASATDLVDGTVALVCTPPSGTVFALGSTTTVNCSATDAHNNTSHASFHVSVVDTTPPTITSISVTPNTLWPPDHSMVPVTVTATATDLVDPHPFLHIVSITSNQAVDAVDAGDAETSPDWEITGPMTANLRAERTSGTDRVYTIVVQAVDFSDNSTWATVEVRVSQQSSKPRASH